MWSSLKSVEDIQEALDSLPSEGVLARKIWKDDGLFVFLITEVIQNDERESLHEEFWERLNLVMRLTDKEKEQRCDIIDYFVSNGLLEEISREFSRSSRRIRVLENALACLGAVCLSPKLAEKVVSGPVLDQILQESQNVPTLTSVYSLISLTNLAIHPSCHRQLLDSNILESAQQLLKYLDSRDEGELDCGLSASFIICRLVGKEEDGVGVELIERTPKVLEKLLWIFEKVVAAGNKPVLGSYWNPANILLDISILSKSKTIRQKMEKFIPIILKAVQKRGKNNSRLVELSVVAMSNLFLDLKTTFLDQKEDISQVLSDISQGKYLCSALSKNESLALKVAMDNQEETRGVQLAILLASVTTIPRVREKSIFRILPKELIPLILKSCN